MHRYKRGAPGLMQEPAGYMGLGTRQGGSTKVSESDPARAPERRGGLTARPTLTPLLPSHSWASCRACLQHCSISVRPGEQILKGVRVLVPLNCCCFVSPMLACEQEFWNPPVTMGQSSNTSAFVPQRLPACLHAYLNSHP